MTELENLLKTAERARELVRLSGEKPNFIELDAKLRLLAAGLPENYSIYFATSFEAGIPTPVPFVSVGGEITGGQLYEAGGSVSYFDVKSVMASGGVSPLPASLDIEIGIFKGGAEDIKGSAFQVEATAGVFGVGFTFSDRSMLDAGVDVLRGATSGDLRGVANYFIENASPGSGMHLIGGASVSANVEIGYTTIDRTIPSKDVHIPPKQLEGVLRGTIPSPDLKDLKIRGTIDDKIFDRVENIRQQLRSSIRGDRSESGEGQNTATAGAQKTSQLDALAAARGIPGQQVAGSNIGPGTLPPGGDPFAGPGALGEQGGLAAPVINAGFSPAQAQAAPPQDPRAQAPRGPLPFRGMFQRPSQAGPQAGLQAGAQVPPQGAPSPTRARQTALGAALQGRVPFPPRQSNPLPLPQMQAKNQFAQLNQARAQQQAQAQMQALAQARAQGQGQAHAGSQARQQVGGQGGVQGGSPAQFPSGSPFEQAIQRGRGVPGGSLPGAGRPSAGRPSAGLPGRNAQPPAKNAGPAQVPAPSALPEAPNAAPSAASNSAPQSTSMSSLKRAIAKTEEGPTVLNDIAEEKRSQGLAPALTEDDLMDAADLVGIDGEAYLAGDTDQLTEDADFPDLDNETLDGQSDFEGDTGLNPFITKRFENSLLETPLRSPRPKKKIKIRKPAQRSKNKR
jgi:hypothetical protein